MAQPVEMGFQRLQPALFGPAAGDPVDGVVAGKRLGRGIRVGGLTVIDVGNAVDNRYLLLAVDQSRVALDAGHDHMGLGAGGLGGGVGRGGVLPIVHAGQGRHPLQVEHRHRLALGVVVEHPVDGVDAAGDELGTGNGNHHLVALGLEILVDGAGAIVVDADHRRARRRLAVENQLFGGNVVVHGAVAVQVIGADIEQHRHVEGDRHGEFELEGGHLQHIGPALAQGIEVKRRNAQVAAHFRLAARDLQDVPDEGRGGGLAVGAGDPDESRFALGADQQLGVADDLEAGGAGHFDHRMLVGPALGNAGAEDQGGQLTPVAAVKVDQGNVGLAGLGAGVLAVVPGPHVGLGLGQRLRRRQPRAAEPEDGNGKTGEGEHGNHGPSLTAASGWQGRPGLRWWR